MGGPCGQRALFPEDRVPGFMIMRCSPRRCGRRPPTSDQAAILGVGHATVERDRQQTSNEVQPAADEADEDVEDSAVSQSPPPDDEQPEPDIMAGAVRRRPGPGATQWRAWKRSAYPTVDCGCRAPLSARTGRSARGWPPSAPTIPGTRSGPGGSVTSKAAARQSGGWDRSSQVPGG